MDDARAMTAAGCQAVRSDAARSSRWPFGAAVAVALALAIWGGRWGPVGSSAWSWPALPAAGFILLFAGSWIACLLVLLTFPRALPVSRRWRLILVVAALARLALIGHPVSDDVNRYLWEGRLVRQHINPYRMAPADPALADLAAADPYHGQINHPDMSAVYPPLTLYLFAAVGTLAYHPLAIKAIMIAFDLGALVCLLALMRRRGVDDRWAIFYALNPVVLYSFAGQAHLDVLQVFFMLAALCAYDRRRWALMFICIGLAVQTKYVAMAILPFLLRRDNWPYAGLAVGIMTLPFVPLADGGWGGFFTSLAHFGTGFAVNGPVHSLLKPVLGGIAPASGAGLLIAAALLLAAYGRWWAAGRAGQQRDPAAASFVAVAAILLCLPTVHLWYLAWMVPFIALRPSGAWLLLCLTAGWYFTAEGARWLTGQWHLAGLYVGLIWAPFGPLFIRQGFLMWHRRRTPADGIAASVSVVVPTRNEAGTITRCLAAVSCHPAVTEVIVVDAGSGDDTVDLARRAGARIIEHRRPVEAGGGRGGQIHAGVAAADGDVVMIVHADTVVPAGSVDRMLAVLDRQPEVIGGAVGGGFDGRGLQLRILDVLNDARAGLGGISFGDQVQFFRRRPVVTANRYPAIPLMEDIELSLRLSRMGRRVYLFGDVRMSARKWRTAGAGRAVSIIALFCRYLWQRLWHRPDTVAMYRRYYGPARGQRNDPDMGLDSTRALG